MTKATPGSSPRFQPRFGAHAGFGGSQAAVPVSTRLRLALGRIGRPASVSAILDMDREIQRDHRFRHVLTSDESRGVMARRTSLFRRAGQNAAEEPLWALADGA